MHKASNRAHSAIAPKTAPITTAAGAEWFRDVDVASDGIPVADALGTTVVREGSTMLKVISESSEGLEVVEDSVRAVANMEVSRVAEVMNKLVGSDVWAEDAKKTLAM